MAFEHSLSEELNFTKLKKAYKEIAIEEVKE